MIVHWDVDPIIFEVFGFQARYYGLMFATGLALGYFVVKKYFIKQNRSMFHLEKLALYIFIATLLGARIGHCLFYEPSYYLTKPWEIILPLTFENGIQFVGFRGLASHGGVAGVFLAIYLFCRKYKFHFISLLDTIAAASGITACFIRLANFFNSEIIGRATNADYGVVFERIDSIARHPAQLYEASAYLAIFILLHQLHKRGNFRKYPGFIFSLLFVILFIARFLIEFFKENQVAFEDQMSLNMGQWLSIPFVLFGAIIMFLSLQGKFRKNQVVA